MSAAPMIVSIGGGLVNKDGCGAPGMLRVFCQLTKPGASSRNDGDRGAGTLFFCNEDAMLVQRSRQRYCIERER